QIERMSDEIVGGLLDRTSDALAAHGNYQIIRNWMSQFKDEEVGLAEALVTISKQIMARECACFHVALKTSGEQEPFIPFRSWGHSLVEGTDAVVTFNYD